MSRRRHAQPTACRKDEGTRVRRVAPKLSSQTESRMPSREAAQLKVSGLGSHVAVKRAREWKEEGGGLVGGARLRKNQQSRSIPCAKAARCARAAIAPTHVEHEERRNTERDRARVGAWTPVLRVNTSRRPLLKDTGGAGTHTGHTRDTRAHTGTLISQTNLTTVHTGTV